MVPTPRGEARLVRFGAARPRLTVLLTHGAGGGIDAHDLQTLARALPRVGVSVVLVEMPWRVAGKPLAPPPAAIDECYLAVIDGLRSRTPVVLGGRSAGARSACRLATSVSAAGVVALSFPLHPPGRPEKSRLHELVGAGVPTLVVQGGNDPFGKPEEFPETTDLTVVPEGDHGLKVPKRTGLSPDDVAAIVAEATLEWIDREVVGGDGGNHRG